jgi:tetratricopeptide (TPR) repeat protein
VLLVAESQGYLSPEKAAALTAQVRRTQADLERLRRDHPDWAGEVDAAIRAFNASDLAGARAAFARIDALIEERRAALLAEEADLRLEQARSKHAQATLFHPFEASRAEPLLTAAAELAQTDVWYWIECGRARVAVGALGRALAAFGSAERVARAKGRDRDLAAALTDIGDVRVAQGDRPGSLAAYEEGLTILCGLAGRDPGHTGLARDVSVSLNKVGDVRLAEGDRPGALAAYEKGLAIARALAGRDPGDAEWARDVSVSLERVGDVRLAGGDRPGALAAYEERLAIARGLAGRDPGNAEWARDVCASLWKTAQADETNAAAHWAEVVARMEAMAARGVLLPADAPYLDAARAKLAAARGG